MKIADYFVLETLSHGPRVTVYKAKKENNTTSVVLKVTEKKTAEKLDIVRSLEHEYQYIKQVDSDFVIKGIHWQEEKEVAFIVLEDIDAQSLKHFIKEKQLSIPQFLDLAKKIVDGLAAIHRQNIIHKDINPSNIIWNPETGGLKIIDFNIASKFDLKLSYLGNPEKLKGTLAYISPEQTGRMNRRVDQRTDLYSLGVTFYEMLTGKLPFDSNQPMEIVYAHLAKEPQSPHLLNEAIPEIISRIIHKLMAKNPEDRYQSAEGLKYDLEKCALSHPQTFALGENDYSGKLQIPEKLYGREEELEQLLAVYHRVSQGNKEMILVSGFSGSGKTTLVNEIHKSIAKDRGYYISGKFDQLQRTIPYFAFIQALNQFCQLLLTEKQEVLNLWKVTILNAVGKLGRILTDIIPQLEAVIGNQPEVPEVNGDDAKKRFNYVFLCFLNAVATVEHPLVMFIDDLQWADLASLSLLQLIMEDRKSCYIFLIGAYRDNEVSLSHPLITTLAELKKQAIPIHTIPVKNLSRQNVSALLVDTFKTPRNKNQEELDALTTLIYQKTQGNAFFTLQFIENLFKENLLSFDFKKSRWIWDIKNIEKQNITDNVVALLVKKIKTLPEKTQEVLKLAAAIGNTFESPTLSVISGATEAAHRQALEPSLAEHLVYPIDIGIYKFVHDRIHQAIYSMVPDEDKKHLHLKIGRLLLETFDLQDTSTLSKETDQRIFDTVNHLNIGIDLIIDERERIHLATLNLKAAKHARVAAAFSIGVVYVRTAIRLLPDNSWQQHYDLTLSVYNEAVLASYLFLNLAEMEKYVEIILSSTQNILHRSVAYEYRLLSLIGQNKSQQAVEAILTIFNLLGVTIPPEPSGPETMAIFGEVQTMLTSMNQETIANLPLMTDEAKLQVLRLFYMAGLSFMHGRPTAWPYVISKMIHLILTYGLTAETPYVISLYGVIKVVMGDFPSAYQLGEMAGELLARGIGNQAIQVRTIGIICFYLRGYRTHFKKIAKEMMDTYSLCMEVGDFEYAGYSLGNYLWCLNRTDTPLEEAYQKALNCRETVLQLKQPLPIPPIFIEITICENYLGKAVDPAVLAINYDELFKNLPIGSTGIFSCGANIKQAILFFFFERYDNVLELMVSTENQYNALNMPLTYFRSDIHFYFTLIYIELYTRSESESEKEICITKINENRTIMKQLAEFGPVNFLHKYYLLEAEYGRVTGNNNQAPEFYDKAIETAYENEYINEAALANELAAKYYIRENRRKFATFYFMEARNCYVRWGALAKVKHLDDNYPKYLSLGLPDSSLSRSSLSSTSTGTAGDFLDVKSIIKASQTLSGEVQLKSLLEKLMQILIENAGAQKSILIENNGGRLLIQAEGNTNGVSGILHELPVDESDKIPLSIIHYVAHSKRQLVFDNLSTDPNYTTDEYIQKNQPKSVVCFPILSKGEVSAIVYLENNLVEGVFTPARLEVLNMLSSQIAISVENTHLYETLEEKVRQRTIALQKAHQELEKNHKELAESHRKINDSVNYASKIQEAVLPGEEILNTLLPQHFVFYRPCSVVSGDFYWIKPVGQKIVVATADCTGHGIPGALLSMLGMTFLSEIVPHLAEQNQLSAANVLDQLRQKVKISLKQEGKVRQQRDGMDIALCIIDPADKQLQYAGAYNPFYLIKDNHLLETKADTMPIGFSTKERPFTNHDVRFENGSMVYLFSDGYADQNGEDGEVNFSRVKFKKLLTEISREPVAKQKEVLIQRFEQWRGDLPQRDDVLVLGIRL